MTKPYEPKSGEEWLEDHMVELVIAALVGSIALCAIFIAIDTYGIRKMIQKELVQKSMHSKGMLDLIVALKDKDVPFDFYPGIGLVTKNPIQPV